MLISQTLSPIVTPGLREALLFGGERAEWERIFDEAARFRHDDSVLRVLDSEARREEYRREQERKLVWCAPAPATSRMGRPHIFRALFRKDIGGVTGESDVWADADFAALDGVSGKLQSLVDYIDNTHLFAQASSGSQPSAPAANVLLANAKTTVFGSALALVSNRGLPVWKILANGTGSTVVLVFVPRAAPGDYATVGGTSSSTAAAGLFIGQRTANKTTMYNYRVGSTNYFLDASSQTYTVGAGYYMIHTYGSSAWSHFDKSVSGGSGADSGAPGTGNPSFAMTLGMLPTRTGGAFDLRAFYQLRRAASAAEAVVFRSYIQKDTGVV